MASKLSLQKANKKIYQRDTKFCETWKFFTLPPPARKWREILWPIKGEKASIRKETYAFWAKSGCRPFWQCFACPTTHKNHFENQTSIALKFPQHLIICLRERFQKSKWKFKMAFAIPLPRPPPAPPLNGTNFQTFFYPYFSFALESYIYETYFTLGLSQKYQF